MKLATLCAAAAIASCSFASHAQSDISGSWYNPKQSGHGHSVDQISAETTLMHWFTYDFAGNPMPLYAEGKRSGNAFVGTAYAPYGPRFGDFDPAELIFESWGTLSFAPTTCGAATLSWNSNAVDGSQTFGTGQTPMQALAPLSCSPHAPQIPAKLAGLSGIWYHTQLQGAGLNVQVLNDRSALIYWYTYDQHGQPKPLYIEAAIDGQRLDGKAYAPRGMRFGEFSRSTLQVEDFGNVSLEFHDCDSATLKYDTPLGKGELPISRLTKPFEPSCQLADATPAGLGPRYSGAMALLNGEPAGAVSMLVNSRDELLVSIVMSGQYRGAFHYENGQRMLHLGRTGDWPLATFGRQLKGPVHYDAQADRLTATLVDEHGTKAILTLPESARALGYDPSKTTLAAALPGTYGEDRHIVWIYLGPRIEIRPDLSFDVVEDGRIAARGKIRNLDSATGVFDFDLRRESWYSGSNDRIFGSGRLETGVTDYPWQKPPVTLMLLGLGAGETLPAQEQATVFYYNRRFQ
jgi:hypothetical protein